MSPELVAARQYLQAGDLQRAERLYGRILQADPQNRDALHEMGMVAIRIGKPEAAIGYLEQAAALDGGDAAVQNHLGVALAGLERFDEAIECLRRAIQLDPRLADAHYNLGKALHAAKRLEEADRKSTRLNSSH